MRTSCIPIAPIHNRLMIGSCIGLSVSWAKRTMLERITHHAYRPRCTYNITHSGFVYKMRPINFSTQIYKIERATAWDSPYLPICCTLRTHTDYIVCHSTDANYHFTEYPIGNKSQCVFYTLLQFKLGRCTKTESLKLCVVSFPFLVRDCDKNANVVIKVGK